MSWEQREEKRRQCLQWCNATKVRYDMESARKGNKILLVDDEPDIVMAFKLTLESAGFIVDTHEDPLTALSKFKPSYYDLVILDIKMPKMNGFESLDRNAKDRQSS